MTAHEWVPLVIAADALVTALVLWLVIRRVKISFKIRVGGNFADMSHFAKESQASIAEYMRANYSGDPAALPQVLSALKARLESDAAARNLTLDGDVLKLMLSRSIIAQRLAPAKDVHRALDRAA